MPPKNKLRRRVSGWTDQHIEILKAGSDYFSEFPEEDRLAAWRELKRQILADWIIESPGTRPWAWWAFDMPKTSRRERLDGIHPHDDAGYDLPKDLYFGKPRCLRACDIGAVFESQEAYLRRMNFFKEPN